MRRDLNQWQLALHTAWTRYKAQGMDRLASACLTLLHEDLITTHKGDNMIGNLRPTLKTYQVHPRYAEWFTTLRPVMACPYCGDVIAWGHDDADHVRGS